ncbi:AI-2E family transporter [Corynebacterium striatum]|uniref:AI-2E family transporter n=1 Tax=Corynebacterium striatum TaxID=43770 RepID=A0ABX7DC80_CORST|nr:AI-2E family transporter [Corynebacterium striatum]MDK8824919.1 AI-2E family transporter [Corynebacterium striatum]MDK8831736.1 AI-2E family transporter [Corynebacterium striatum]MDK8875700.1 AI-2E family transporter [Corynebacterium striatum]QQU76240.1 AI-2E family transporter [Corynebacterium striatum]QRP19666.1 AI-2E family transporter [Corynebacterium striatum]
MTNNNDDGARSGTSSTASDAAASAAAEQSAAAKPISEEATLPVSKTDDKSRVLGRDAISLAKVCLVFIIVVAGVGLAGYLLKFIWVGLLPVILAILVCTVLFPVTNWLRAHKFPRALASITTLLGFLAIIGGVFAAMAPVVSSQGASLVNQAEGGLNKLVDMAKDLPFEIDAAKVQEVLDDAIAFIKGQASQIATGVISGVSMASSIVMALVIMLFVAFFILKDGDKFLPWLRTYTGYSAGWHATELLTRVWNTLSGFIQAQAAVAAVDAILIGLGLWALQVPLALVIGVVTFFASFIPVIGAVTAGALAVIIALVSDGLTKALLALALIIIVQQVEGNVLQPMLQSKAMGLHAAMVLLSVTVGSALAGIIGAFLAVPVAATVAVVFRYHQEMASLRAGEIEAKNIKISTAEGHEDVMELYENLEASSAR